MFPLSTRVTPVRVYRVSSVVDSILQLWITSPPHAAIWLEFRKLMYFWSKCSLCCVWVATTPTWLSVQLKPSAFHQCSMFNMEILEHGISLSTLEPSFRQHNSEANSFQQKLIIVFKICIHDTNKRIISSSTFTGSNEHLERSEQVTIFGGCERLY